MSNMPVALLQSSSAFLALSEFLQIRDDIHSPSVDYLLLENVRGLGSCKENGTNAEADCYTMTEVIKEVRRSSFHFFCAALLEGQSCGLPMQRDRYILVASRHLDIRTWFFSQVRDFNMLLPRPAAARSL